MTKESTQGSLELQRTSNTPDGYTDRDFNYYIYIYIYLTVFPRTCPQIYVNW